MYENGKENDLIRVILANLNIGTHTLGHEI